MEAKRILEILKDFNCSDTYKKIFINGRWGIGKSFYATKFMSLNKNVIYVSLFGKDRLNQIEDEIIHKLLKRLDGKEKYIKNVIKIIKNMTGSISISGVTINMSDIMKKSFIEDYHKCLKDENLIILIDDLERKSGKLAIEDILGVIEQISLNEKTKIVLIGDENKIAEEDFEIWSSFKEKIIEKQYNVSSFSKDAINSIVISKLKKYIDEEELKEFIENFIEKFPISNLRTIKKAVNLFLEIVNTHLKKQFKNINLVLLKTCLAVVIEKTENLFEPKSEEKNKEENSVLDDSFFDLSEINIESRIEMHYFNSSLGMNKQAALIHYILLIYDGTYTSNTLDDFNKVIEKYLCRNEEKAIFYLDENKIKQIVLNKYNWIIEEKYEYTCLDEFINDIFSILEWYDVFELECDNEKLKQSIFEILFKNYYDKQKEFHENIVDRFELKFKENNKLKEYIEEYNKKVEEKYYEDKLEEIEKTFNDKEFDIGKVSWLSQVLIQDNKEVHIERFMKKARKNNYFLADMTEEISEDIWGWIHYIWSIFYKYMPQKYKDEINNYVNSLKNDNKLNNFRINILQQKRQMNSK